MPARRKWSGLSKSTQTRYSRAGISPQAYESGVSLKKARGHERTPEHLIIDPQKLTPEQRERYSEYITNRRELTLEVINLKQEMWGDDFKFRGRSSAINTRGGSLRDMRYALGASIEDLEQLASQAAIEAANGVKNPRWAFLWYH